MSYDSDSDDGYSMAARHADAYNKATRGVPQEDIKKSAAAAEERYRAALKLVERAAATERAVKAKMVALAKSIKDDEDKKKLEDLSLELDPDRQEWFSEFKSLKMGGRKTRRSKKNSKKTRKH